MARHFRKHLHAQAFHFLKCLKKKNSCEKKIKKKKSENDLYIWALPELGSSLVPPCPGPYSGKAHSLGCFPYTRYALKKPWSKKVFFNRRLLFSNWPLCLTMYVSWWSCSLIVIILFWQQARSMLYFESIIFDPEYEGSICTSHADIFLSLPPLDIILTMKVVAPDKALMCSRSSRLLVFR
jgi:hypothetical protein